MSPPATVTRCPECGAEPASCEALFHTVLALDHSRRPPWGPLHGVTVACFLLQHPSRLPEADRSRPWAIVRTYVEEGLAATTRLTEQTRRANSHRRGAPPPEHESIPPATPPTAFPVTIADVAVDGTFPAEGFADRVAAWAEATLTAWRGHGGSAP